jgi:N-acetyl-alpha-D-glucosaminyl L-malate synthase BshA
MNIGIVCYASVGGSGIIATELAMSLASRGHDVHLISTDTPFRMQDYQPHLWFHRVNTPAYPLFREPQYVISLATRIVQIVREFKLDIVHAHYAVPHATAAYLAKEIMKAAHDVPVVPRVITTLHGTDITLVGRDPSYAETVAFSIGQSDRVTAVSESLKCDTDRVLAVEREIVVIPNFLDCAVYRRIPHPELRARLCPPPFEKVVMHASNFRPVKRVSAVVDVFARMAGEVPARLLLVGDGPDLGLALDRAKKLGVAHAVEALGEQEDMVPLFSVADLFLLPSEQESFGLSALEAMSCGVPVVASRVGGLHEVVEHGESGYLHPMEDVDGMAQSGIRLLTDPDLHRRFVQRGREIVTTQFCTDRVVPMYEALYESLVPRP